MASCPAVVASPHLLRLHPRWLPTVNPPRAAALLHRSLRTRSWYSRAARPGTPLPPPSPSGGDDISGLLVTLSKIQDRARIFFAILFWMSLFFWGSAWDGRDRARKNKGPRLRK